MARPGQAYKRRHFFIKKNFQSRFIFQFSIMVLFGAILSTSLIVYFSKGSLTALFSQSRLTVTDTALYLLPTVVYTNLITIIIIAVAMILVTLFVSHKIAGPMFRLEKEVMAIAEGDLTLTIRLRKKDQLRELGENFNEMTSSLNQNVCEIKAELEKIITSASENDTPQWFSDKLDRLYREMSENFKLEKPESVQPKPSIPGLSG